MPGTMVIQRGADGALKRVVVLLCSRHSRWPGGMSHRELAERSGLTKSYVTRFLNGQCRNPTLYTLVALASALDAALEFDLAGTNLG